MALEARVTVHGNPFENLVVWEKRSPLSNQKHRGRTPETLKTVDTIVIRSDNGKDEYHTDYCVLAAATKGSSSQHRQISPVLLSDRDKHSHLSATSYKSFARTHTSGPLYVEQSSAVTPQPGSRELNSSTPSCPPSRSKHTEDDVKVFCCNRTVESLIDYATCMCCVKGAIYHCTKDTYEEGYPAEEPCTCDQDPSTRTCISRWMCMAVCSLFLPCVMCYLPARGCLHVCTCYKGHRTASARRQRGRIKTPH